MTTDRHNDDDVVPGSYVSGDGESGAGLVSVFPGLSVLPPAPELARVAVSSMLTVASWSAAAWWDVGRRLMRARYDPREAAELAQELGIAVGALSLVARQVALGVPLQEALNELSSSGLPSREDAPERVTIGPEALRERGQQLVHYSADVDDPEGPHPAHLRILDQLAPDEARIILLLSRGPQAAVDIRTGGPIGSLSSTLIAPGLSMVGARAAVRHAESVPSYLNNLHRLGLVWFSRERVDDPAVYTVLEAQPEVLKAMHSVRFPKVVRRSIHLTPFGLDFCKACLVSEAVEAELSDPGTVAEVVGRFDDRH